MGDERTYEYTIAVRVVEVQGWDDRGLGETALRGIGKNVQSHHQ